MLPHCKKHHFFLLIAAILSSAWNAIAQESDTKENKFILSAQLQPRFEIRDGAFRPLTPTEKPAAFISERIRLTMDYSYGDAFSIRISPQSVGIWGQANMVQGAENSGNQLSLFEAWAKLNITDAWNVKVGRQVISLDDERFFGELDWAQGARAHDAASIHFHQSKWDVKGFFAYNQNYKTLYSNNLSNPTGNLYNTTDAFSYKWMQTIWSSYQFNKKSKLSLLATNLGLQQARATSLDTPTYYSQTFGANYFYNDKKLIGNASAYYQMGKNATGINTQAYLVAIGVGYNLTKNWNVGMGSELVSGNDIGKAQTNNTAFNPYFHTGHKFYGTMDYYYVGNAHKNVGLFDNFVKVNYKTAKGNMVNLAFHQFFTPNTVLDNTNHEYRKNLGQEVDLSFSYKVYPFVNLSGGYSFYLVTPTVNYLKNTPTAHTYQQWFWLSLKVTPTLLKSKF